MGSSFGASAELRAEVSLSDLLNDHRRTRSTPMDNAALAGVDGTSNCALLIADWLAACVQVRCRATEEDGSEGERCRLAGGLVQ